jgi:hypothetical protein
MPKNKGWEEHISHLPGGMYGPKPTRHLDTAIEIFKSDKAKRAKQAGLVLTFIGKVGQRYEAILQGPRGKMIATYSGTKADIIKQAKAHAERAGKSLEVYE